MARRLLLFVPLLLVAAMSTEVSGGESRRWCVCRPEVAGAALQRTLDYACGHGADCAPLLPGGRCHGDMDTVAARCSYAANSYYQRSGGATCDFDGTATISSTDPSSGGCEYPATRPNDDMGASTTPIGRPAGDDVTGPALLLLLSIPLLSALIVFCDVQYKRRRLDRRLGEEIM